MNSAYLAEIRRFGGPSPYKDQNDKRCNLRHDTDFLPGDVETDGCGNVTSMPLLPKKPCFGRPERFFRALVGSTPWLDKDWERRPGNTPCNTCFERSPGVYEACLNLSEERVASHPNIQAMLDDWMRETGDTLGMRAFAGRLGQRWQKFLEAIIHVGGWSNVNDDQLRVFLQVKSTEDRVRRNDIRKAKRIRERDLLRGRAKPITADFLHALDTERDRRALGLKALRLLPVAAGRKMSWLSRMSDATCDRIADVWREREIGKRTGEDLTQREIVRRMFAAGRRHGATSEAVLAARVSEDVKKRLARLEDERGGNPIWARWDHSEVT